MSQVATDFQTQASSVLPKADRPSFASQKAPTSRFDDLLSSIPDAPPEPRARASADERPQPAQSRSANRDDRPGREDRAGRPDRADRTAKADGKSNARVDDSRTAPATDAPAKDAAEEPKADTTVTETKPAGTNDTAKTDDAGQTTETPSADTAPVTEAAVAALVPQAVAIDPAVTAAAPSLDGDKAAKPAEAKAEVPTAATHPSVKTAEQQAAAPADQSTGLSADDAEVLSALAAKALRGAKQAPGEKTEVKTDKPAPAAKPNTETAPGAATAQPAAPDGGEAKTAEAKPVQSDLAKLGVEHQRSQGDGNAKTGGETAPAAATANAAAVKSPDTFAMHLLPASGHSAHATAASAADNAPGQSAGSDKPVAIANVAVEVSAKISAGKNQFDIRLDPEELGRIHVKVNVDRDGNITTHMVADRPDTLDLLRRDTQGLERALQDAGLKTSDNSLQFSLRDQTQQQQQNQQDGQASRRPLADDDLTPTVTTTVIARDYGRYLSRPSGVDIRV